MPEHIHVLLSEPQRGTLADAVKSLKQGVSRRLIGAAEHFWQKRYYDFNVRNYEQFFEKLNYIHRNPVKRELCELAGDWEWSSYRQYATGCEGRVEIECEWLARRRERAAGKLVPALPLPHSSQNRAWVGHRPEDIACGKLIVDWPGSETRKLAENEVHADDKERIASIDLADIASGKIRVVNG
jgi:hypothetical protein